MPAQTIRTEQGQKQSQSQRQAQIQRYIQAEAEHLRSSIRSSARLHEYWESGDHIQEEPEQESLDQNQETEEEMQDIFEENEENEGISGSDYPKAISLLHLMERPSELRILENLLSRYAPELAIKKSSQELHTITRELLLYFRFLNTKEFSQRISSQEILQYRKDFLNPDCILFQIATEFFPKLEPIYNTWKHHQPKLIQEAPYCEIIANVFYSTSCPCPRWQIPEDIQEVMETLESKKISLEIFPAWRYLDACRRIAIFLQKNATKGITAFCEAIIKGENQKNALQQYFLYQPRIYPRGLLRTLNQEQPRQREISTVYLSKILHKRPDASLLFDLQEHGNYTFPLRKFLGRSSKSFSFSTNYLKAVIERYKGIPEEVCRYISEDKSLSDSMRTQFIKKIQDKSFRWPEIVKNHAETVDSDEEIQEEDDEEERKIIEAIVDFIIKCK